ncbi:MAG: RimK family alpha-L-glutamate ligase [Actinomycetota bacterium]
MSSRLRLEERLVLEAFERRGVAAAHVDDRRLVFRLGSRVELGSIVLNRSLSMTRRRYISRLCEAGGVPVVNSSRVVETCDDKVRTTLALLAHAIPVPTTTIALSPEHGIDAIRDVGFPAVVKPVNGSWGRLLSRVNDVDAAEAVLEHKAALGSPENKPVYAQPYIDKPGRDIRAIVIDGEVIAAIYRHSDHWVTNAARSSLTSICPISNELEAMCVASAAAVGGGAVAIDVLECSSGELLVNEVNATMEFRGAVEATGADVAGRLADYVLRERTR